MKFFARILCAFAIVAFAASAIGQSAGAAAMASAMITADASVPVMDGCDASGDPEACIDDIVCEFACGAPALTAIPAAPAGTIPAVASDAHVSLPKRTLRGVAGPLFTQPPRSHL